MIKSRWNSSNYLLQEMYFISLLFNFRNGLYNAVQLCKHSGWHTAKAVRQIRRNSENKILTQSPEEKQWLKDNQMWDLLYNVGPGERARISELFETWPGFLGGGGIGPNLLKTTFYDFRESHYCNVYDSLDC